MPVTGGRRAARFLLTSGPERKGRIMASVSPVTQRVLAEVKRMHGCDLDTLRQHLSDLSWSQVFLEVDRLSRKGALLVSYGADGLYRIRLPERKHAAMGHHAKP